MGFFGKILEAGVNVVLAPVDIVKDVVTMGGALTDQDKPYTVDRLGKIVTNVEEAAEKAGEGDII